MLLDRLFDDALFMPLWSQNSALGNGALRGAGKQVYRLALPGIKPEEVEAKMADGVLTITVNHTVEEAPITIESNEAKQLDTA